MIYLSRLLGGCVLNSNATKSLKLGLLVTTQSFTISIAPILLDTSTIAFAGSS